MALLKAVKHVAPISRKVQFLEDGPKDWKMLIRSSPITNQKLTLTDLKNQIENAKDNIILADLYTDGLKITDKQKKLIQQGADVAAKYIGSRSWRNKAVKYAGLTKEEAKKTQKYMVDNIYRYPWSSQSIIDPRIGGFNASYPSSYTNLLGVNFYNPSKIQNRSDAIHEALHASWRFWNENPERFIKDKDVLNGIQKLTKHRKSLADEVRNNTAKQAYWAFGEDVNTYWLDPDEVFARMSTGKAKWLPSQLVTNVEDQFKKFVKPEVYKDVYKRMVATLPAIGGAALYNSQDNERYNQSMWS